MRKFLFSVFGFVDLLAAYFWPLVVCLVGVIWVEWLGFYGFAWLVYVATSLCVCGWVCGLCAVCWFGVWRL